LPLVLGGAKSPFISASEAAHIRPRSSCNVERYWMSSSEIFDPGPPIAPLAVKPKIAWKMLACGNTCGYELLAAGKLDSFLDGRSRKITVDSIHRYIQGHLREVRRQTDGNGVDPSTERRGKQ
jgi:hypothetical protein